MNFWASMTAIQFISVIVCGCSLLLSYANYRRHREKIFLRLLAYSAACLLFCSAYLIYDAGKVSGVW